MAKGEVWTQKEIKYLIKNWKTSNCTTIAKELGRKEQSCYDKAHNLGLKKRNITSGSIKDKRAITIRKNALASKWTTSEVNFLRENAGKLTDREISEKLGKTIPAVYCKRRSLEKVKNPRPAVDAKEIKAKHFKSWSKEEESLLKEEFNKTPIKELAQVLGRTEDAVKVRAYTLGLIPTSEERPRTKWTEEEIKYIKKNIYSKSYEEIGEYLGRSAAAVASKASTLKISRSPLRKKKNLPLKTLTLAISIAVNISLFTGVILLLLR